MMLVGYLYGIASDRKLAEEVRMHLAYRWFTGLGLDQDVPDHSTFSKNRHGRFRQSQVFREVFEEIVTRCIHEGLVEGKHVSVDGTQILADAACGSLRPASELAQVAKVSWGLREYLEEVEKQNPGAEEPTEDDPMESGRPTMKEKENPERSSTDPDASLCRKQGGPAKLSYFSNYLMDNKSRVILGVEATPARFNHEALAARAMIPKTKEMDAEAPDNRSPGQGLWRRSLLWPGSGNKRYAPIFRSWNTPEKGSSRKSSFDTIPRQTPTSVLKVDHFIIEAKKTPVRAMSTALRPSDAQAAVSN